MVYAVHILACIVYNDIHNAWVPVCGTLCILYQDHKLDSVCLLLTTYLQSAVGQKRKRCNRCEACKNAECGKCRYCVDKPKFGGPNKLKKCCMATLI